MVKKRKNKPTDRKVLKKVFIYMRYSSNMQNPMSIDAQRRIIKEFCKKHGYIIEKEFVDEAKSATTDDREAFQQMMKEAKATDIDAVVVHKFDRFSRNMSDATTYECILQKMGVDLISVTEPNDNSPVSILMRNIMFSTSDFFSRNLATEVQKGKKEAAYNCWHVGGLPPYGYDVGEDRKYIINDKESKAVILIFDMYSNDYSYQQIADYLNKNGYTTKKGLPFNKNSFSSILENAERYTGVYIYNRAASKYHDGTRNSHRYKDESEIIKIPDGMPRIITDKTYNKFLAKKEANREISGTYHSKRYYLLNGLITCGECGRAYTGNTSFAGRNKTEYATYRCGAYRDGCKNKAVNIKYLNDFVLDLLIDIIFDKKNYNRIMKALNEKIDKRNAKASNKKKSIKNEITQLDFAISKLTDALMQSDNLSSLTDKLAELENKKIALNNKYEYYNNYKADNVTSDEIDKVKKLFKKYLLKKDLLVCRKLIRSFVDKIIVYDDRVEVVIKTSLEHRKEHTKSA